MDDRRDPSEGEAAAGTSERSEPIQHLRVTEIGEYIRHRSCERRFKLEINNRQIARKLPFAERLFNTLDPVLQEAGRVRERRWEKSLQQGDLIDLTEYADRPDDAKPTPWDEVAGEMASLGTGHDAYAREVHVSAPVGGFSLEGRIDFILVLWRGGRPLLRLVECKASRRDRTYHRIQVAIYGIIIRRLLKDNPLEIAGVAVRPEDVECAVARIDEATNASQEILAIEALDLEMEDADIERLLADDGALRRIVDTDLASLDFKLDQKCDGCVFNIHCLSESGRQRRLELLGVEPSSVRVLRTAGIETIDDLATLSLTSDKARLVREDSGFNESLDHLRLQALARRKTLIDGDPDTYEVSPLPNSGDGQLPSHMIGGVRLVRIYLCVDYDYAENRIGGLAAHVTASTGQIHSGFVEANEGWRPDPHLRERHVVGKDSEGRRQIETSEVHGKNIVEFIPDEWTGRYDVDSGVEKQLIHGFFQKLVDAIAETAAATETPIHFYVWSRSEMARLVEACSRVSSQLVSHLRELLGCRESLEQLLYSCLQEEVDRRYALGWTGRGLAVVSSLRWFGRRYHWCRVVAGATVNLDRAFEQDIFDFKTDLGLAEDGYWAEESTVPARTHKFEIRSRFHDSLTAPYWRAYWRTLPNPDDPGLRPEVRNAIRRYNRATGPGVLRAYLEARTHALRWVEESVSFKNDGITKPKMRVADLPSFRLGVDTAAQASIDFLRLDQHVKVTDWIARHLVPPANRIGGGRTVPVSGVVSHGSHELSATIDLSGFGIGVAGLRRHCSIAQGSFVRLSPRSQDPRHGQSFGQLVRGGKTCRVESINWDTGRITLKALWIRATRYVLLSTGAMDPGTVFDFATIDESPSDFVAGRVEDRLKAGQGTYAFQWFDPENPQIPRIPDLDPESLPEIEAFLRSMQLSMDRGLAEDQIRAVLDGLGTRVQLLQGPPGTGKTTTTAVSTLTRILARRRPGDVILVSAHTHTAVDTILRHIDDIVSTYRQQASSRGLAVPRINLAKVHSSKDGDPVGGNVLGFWSQSCVRFVNKHRKDAVLIVGGTTGALLKMASSLSKGAAFRGVPEGFQAPLLVVDEASMMVFPHFLALCTLVKQDGEVMLAGDHRQLAPIVAHDWEREDRPPAVLYQPFASAYQAVQNISTNHRLPSRAIQRSALSFTFRLPPVIRDLISRLYRLDDIALDGLPRETGDVKAGEAGSWNQVWEGDTGLFLVLHSERSSRLSNPLEAKIVEAILAGGGTLPNGSVAIMTPHRAQRSLLTTTLTPFSATADVIDTVERLQGGERPTVIVSATASDPSAIAANVDFVLNLNRSNVAFSRAQDRLIVICSDTLIDHIPAEVEHYESAMLWKSLRAICSRRVGGTSIDGHRVRVFTLPVEAPAP